MKSKTQLLERDLPAMPELKYVGNETYGRQSCIYLGLVGEVTRERKNELVDELEAKGHKIGKGWTRNEANKGIEVQVSYFKGWHWNE